MAQSGAYEQNEISAKHDDESDIEVKILKTSNV